MAWWRPECPVRTVEQEWIDESMDWFVAEFGEDRLRGDVVLPNDDFFPGAYEGSPEDVERVVGLLCRHMSINRDRIELVHDPDDDADAKALADQVPLNSRFRGAAGHHVMRKGRSVIGIRSDQAAAPMALVATIAHELGHALLLGDERITADRADHEPLTDLLTVYYGLGIFTANAAFEFRNDRRSWSTNRLGYLTEPMYGYGLARYAWLRGEESPEWAGYLDTNPRTFLRQGLRYLAHVPRSTTDHD
jgi:hypothetical protein